MITLVTSLYNINRQSMDGRSYQDYLAWFAKTLKINCNMLIFVDKADADFVAANRSRSNTQIIEKPLQDMPMFSLKDRMDEIISSDYFKNNIRDNSRIECRYSLYNIVQYSKFDWMEIASQYNYFNSQYFIWVDAGLSRFFYDLNLSKKYPSNFYENELLKDKYKILVQVFKNSYPDLFFASQLDESYLKDNRSYVMGGMFGGGAEAIKVMAANIKTTLQYMLDNQFVNNEQIAIGYLLKKNPQLFNIIVNDSSIHRNYEIINLLARENL